MSESKIVIEYEILAREFCIVSGEFSDLWCLMNTLYTKLTLRKKPTVLQTRQLSIIVNTPVWEGDVQFPAYQLHTARYAKSSWQPCDVTKTYKDCG